MLCRTGGRQAGAGRAPVELSPLLARSQATASGQPLTPALAATLQPCIEQLGARLGPHCLSDFSYPNLYLFRQAHDYRFVGGPWPGISGRTYDGQGHFFPLFEITKAPAQVLDDMLTEHGCLFPLAAPSLHGLDSGRYHWSASRDDADYLYPIANFLHYRGRVLQKKRNLLKQCLRSHELRCEPLGEATAGAARAVLRQWMLAKGKRPGQADHLPCMEAISQPRALGLEGRVYFAGGRPAGFVIAQSLHARTWAVRFAKGNDTVKGIYPWMFHELATALADRADWLNFEQDLGEPGFRQSKMSYQPSGLLPKYRLRAAS
jgi:hypothetical protein